MKMLMKRTQGYSSVFSLVPLRIGSGNTFMLNVQLEYGDDERQLANKYNINRMAFNTDDPVEEIKKAFRTALVVSFVVFVVALVFAGVWNAVPIALLAQLVMTVVYFKTMREQIIIGDLLLGGKTFRCDSVVELIRKEAYLTHMSECLCQVLESAKHWGDREAIDIQALSKEDAKRFVLKHL